MLFDQFQLLLRHSDFIRFEEKKPVRTVGSTATGTDLGGSVGSGASLGTSGGTSTGIATGGAVLFPDSIPNVSALAASVSSLLQFEFLQKPDY